MDMHVHGTRFNGGKVFRAVRLTLHSGDEVVGVVDEPVARPTPTASERQPWRAGCPPTRWRRSQK